MGRAGASLIKAFYTRPAHRTTLFSAQSAWMVVGRNLDALRLHVNLFQMSKLEAIEAEVRKLPLDQAAELQDWLSDYLEDTAELNPEFVASIERGNADLRASRIRIERPKGE
jgi:hypothetical protein